MSTSTDTMKNFFNVLKLYSNDTSTNGIAILDQAVSTVSRFSSLRDAVNNFIYDMAAITSTAGAVQSLYQNCGIVIGANNDFAVDTGAVSGYNAGNGIIKNAQDIVPENALLTQVAYPATTTTYHSYTGNDGQTFYFTIVYPSSILEVRDNNTAPKVNGNPDSPQALSTLLQPGQIYYDTPSKNGKVAYVTFDEAVAGITTMMTGLENFWITEGLKLAYDSFGLDFNGKNLHIVFGINEGAQAITSPTVYDPNYYSNLPATDIEVEINAVLYGRINPYDPSGNTRAVVGGTNQNYLDRTIAHELIHAVMIAHGLLKSGMPEFFTEGVAELVHGLDDFDGNYSDLVLRLATDPGFLEKSLPFVAGTGTDEAYPAGYMFLRYLCHQSLGTQVSIGDGTNPEVFGYTGGEEIISGFASDSQINVGDGIGIAGMTSESADLTVATSAGQLIVRNARDKLVNFADAYGNVFERAYLSSSAGLVDGSEIAERTVLFGANNANNEIYAGDGGSQLWGGSYGNDVLYGGAGADEFIAGKGCGADVIYNANVGDTINLLTTSLGELTAANITADGVFIQTTDGSSVAALGNVGSAFRFASGEVLVADQSSGQWARLA